MSIDDLLAGWAQTARLDDAAADAMVAAIVATPAAEPFDPRRDLADSGQVGGVDRWFWRQHAETIAQAFVGSARAAFAA